MPVDGMCTIEARIYWGAGGREVEGKREREPERGREVHINPPCEAVQSQPFGRTEPFPVRYVCRTARDFGRVRNG